MTRTETGSGDAACTLSFSTAPERSAPAQPVSPSSTTQMATTNIDTSFNNPNSLPFDEKVSTILMSSGNPLPQDDNIMPPENLNYQISHQPTLSFFSNSQGHLEPSCSSSEFEYSPQPSFFWPNTNIDMTTPRSCLQDANVLSPIASTQDQPQASYVNMYEVYPHMQRMELSMAPTSEPYVRIQDDETEPPSQPPEVLESIEPCYQSHHHPMLIHQHEKDTAKQPSLTPFDDEMDTMGDDLDGDKSEPYAKSLFRCLRQAPNHTMILRDIYDWFRGNTDKGHDPHERGWQNSIRHNLSMNKVGDFDPRIRVHSNLFIQAFEKIEVPSGDDPSKKGYQWRLSEQALRDGRVQSTTRYRNKQPNKRGSKSHNPAPHRQASGARGGEMARRAAQVRRSERLREIRNGLQENGDLLRSRGVIRPNGQMPRPSTGVSASSPLYTGLDYFTADPGISQSGPTSPYFFPDDSGVYSTSYPNFEPPVNMMARPLPSPAFHNGSYSSSPEIGGQPEIHFMPIGDRLFYDSPESTSEPRTPGAFSDMHGQDMHLDPTPFFGNPEDSMTF
jgi:hypothetical protein